MAVVFSEIKFACCHLFMYKKKTYHNWKHSVTFAR